MSVLIPSLAVAGEIIAVPGGTQEINVTLPNLVSDYIVSGQLSTPTPCWLEGATDNIATFKFGAPADTDSQLTIIALPAGMPGLSSVVIPGGTDHFDVTVQTGRSVIPICDWNTQVWHEINGNTWTFRFSFPPGGNARFSWLIVGPGQNTIIDSESIDPGDYVATISTPISGNSLPMTSVTWNTAIGMTPSDNQVDLQFTNAAPEFVSTRILTISIPINVSIFPLPEPAPIPTQQPWVVSVITPEDWAQRLITLFPYPWLSDQARAVGGIAYAIFYAMGTELNFLSQQLYYAWTACRLDTAVDGALDLFSQDFFGNNLPREPGESNDAFRLRIKALLFQPQVTRQAIINAIQLAFPGTIVRAIEPWNPGDTGYFGADAPHIGCYYDYDSANVPSLWGDPAARCEGFLEIQLAPAKELAFSLWGYDFAAAYDAQTGYFFDPVTVLQTQVGRINNLINQIVAEGVHIWVKYINGIINPFSVGGSFFIATGLFNFNINTASTTGFYVLFLQLSQAISIWQTGATISGFNVTTGAPVPSSTLLNYLAIENGTPGVGLAAVDAGDTTYQLTADAINNVVFISPQWNTSKYYTGRSLNVINYNFGSAPQYGTVMGTLVVPIGPQAGYIDIDADAISLDIDLTVNAQNIPLVACNWDTEIGCLPDPVNNQIHLTFSVPAPGDGSGEVMYMAYDLA